MFTGSGGRGSPKHVSLKSVRGLAARAVSHPGTIRVRSVHKGDGVPRGMTEHTDAIKNRTINKIAGRAKKEHWSGMDC